MREERVNDTPLGIQLNSSRVQFGDFLLKGRNHLLRSHADIQIDHLMPK